MLDEIAIKRQAHDAFIKIYKDRGYEALKKAVHDFMAKKIGKGIPLEIRNILKGECAEILVNACIRELQMKTDAVCFSVKGLCFTKLDSDYTTELDITLFSPRRVYLFECKSYSGVKTLTDEGFLKGRYSEINVYEQSRMHAEFLWSRIGQCHIGRINKKDPAFQMTLVDVSLEPCSDLRSDSQKRVLTYLTLDTIDKWFAQVLSDIQRGPDQWDIIRLHDVVMAMHKNSKTSFEEHLRRKA